MQYKPNDKNLNVLTFLEALRDDQKDVEKCIEFFNALHRLPAHIPRPFLEMVTVLKLEKPNLFKHLKARLQTNRPLIMLFDLDIDYELAKMRLAEVVLTDTIIKL
ncbi:MAG: hypothetical protein JWM44_2277 [Bacilli bacterium]|nr:hypothetical protein [Bacilli bacterium]